MDRLQLFPDSTRIEKGTLTIGGFDLGYLAGRFDTRLYIYDRATLDNSVHAYKTALENSFPGKSRITYAGKAFLCLAVAEWSQHHQLWVDCSGSGEIAICAAAGVPREHLVAHGVNKSPGDLAAACEHAGIIVVDHPAELRHLVEISKRGIIPDLWLRFQPGLAVETHAYTQTGFAGSKFGMEDIQLLQAAQFCRENSLHLSGIHFHLGSQFRDPSPLAAGIEHALDLARAIDFDGAWTLSPGGGWGVAYNQDELPNPDINEYIGLIARTLVQGCKERSFSLPCLHVEPGRSLVARAGVALYRVGAVKHTSNRTWALLDGGMADNPRPALYGARYSALPVREAARPMKEPVWFAGPFCESGDVLIEGLPFPEIQEGDLVAVPVSGAYQLSMSSNYNGSRRPAVIWLDQGRVQVVQARETADDLFRRDHRLVKPAGSG